MAEFGNNIIILKYLIKYTLLHKFPIPVIYVNQLFYFLEFAKKKSFFIFL